jgi:transglutaminase-like putative cysteine protease
VSAAQGWARHLRPIDLALGATAAGLGLAFGWSPEQAPTLAGAALVAVAVLGRLLGEDRVVLAFCLLAAALHAPLAEAPLALIALAAWVAAWLAAASGGRPVGLGAAVLAGLLAVPFSAPPRPRAPLSGEIGSHQVGFQAQVDLAHASVRLSGDPAPIGTLALSPSGASAPLYLRGRALERFDGLRWTGEATPAASPPAVGPPSRTVEVRLEEAPEGVWPVTGLPVAVESEAPAQWLTDGSLRGEAPASYRLLVRPGFGLTAYPGAEPGPELLALPADLAAQAAARMASLDARGAERPVEAWLQANRRYAPTWEGGDPADPVGRFLRDAEGGHCELFASALAVLGRASGVPTRIVVGWRIDAADDPEGARWTLRRGHAHAWTEAWTPDRGWIGLDATPPGQPPGAWPGASAEAGAGAWALPDPRGAPARAVAALALLLWAVGGWRRVSAPPSLGEPPPNGRVASAWRGARRALDRAGLAPPSALPPVEAAAWVGRRAPALGEALQELAWLHYRVSLAGEDDEALGEAAEGLEARVEAIAEPIAALQGSSSSS